MPASNTGGLFLESKLLDMLALPFEVRIEIDLFLYLGDFVILNLPSLCNQF